MSVHLTSKTLETKLGTQDGVTLRVWAARTCRERVTGLIGVSGLHSGSAVAFENCCWMHTFFMKFPIDLVLLDGQKRVICERRNVLPWRMKMFYREIPFLLELPLGTVASLHIVRGVQIAFECVAERCYITLGQLS